MGRNPSVFLSNLRVKTMFSRVITPLLSLCEGFPADITPIMHAFEADAADSRVCLYTNTPTTDFVVDRQGPLVVAGGFSGHGFKFTPLIGRLIADLVEDRPLTGAARRFALPS